MDRAIKCAGLEVRTHYRTNEVWVWSICFKFDPTKQGKKPNQINIGLNWIIGLIMFTQTTAHPYLDSQKIFITDTLAYIKTWEINYSLKFILDFHRHYEMRKTIRGAILYLFFFLLFFCAFFFSWWSLISGRRVVYRSNGLGWLFTGRDSWFHVGIRWVCDNREAWLVHGVVGSSSLVCNKAGDSSFIFHGHRHQYTNASGWWLLIAFGGSCCKMVSDVFSRFLLTIRSNKPFI